MITRKAYQNKKLVYRAYLNGQLLWDHGRYPMLSLLAALYGQATPKAQTPAQIRMHADGGMNALGLVRTQTFSPVTTRGSGLLDGSAIPHPAEALPGAGSAGGELLASGAAATYGLVFSRGHGAGGLVSQGLPHTAGASYTAGGAVGVTDGAAYPTAKIFSALLMTGGGTGGGHARPMDQSPETALMGSKAQLTASAGVKALPVHTVTFMCGGEVRHQERVVDGYSCPDPVATDVIETPTKAMTAQYAYEYAGWSRTDGGEADADVLTSITEDIVVYAAFSEMLRTYTATFYVDGVLESTQQVPYGENAIPPELTNEGYVLEWLPSDFTIYGDTDFYGTWTRNYVLKEQDLTFAYSEYNGALESETSYLERPVSAMKYAVEWDGLTYICTARDIRIQTANFGATCPAAIGNPGIQKKAIGFDITSVSEVSDEPFYILNQNDGKLFIMTDSPEAVHKVCIYAVQ